MNEKDIYFGIRLGVITVLVIILIVTITDATSSKVIISSILLFLLPMVLDYYSQLPISPKNKRRKELLFWISVFASIITFICLLTIKDYVIKPGLNWWKFSISIIWVFYICVAIMDWIKYSSPEEVAHRKKMRKLAKKKKKKN